MCIVRVRHISPHGPSYTRSHIVTVRGTLLDAVISCGATPPPGATASLCMANGGMPYIVFTDEVMPVCMDPEGIILHMTNLTGGLYVPVPYQCTYEHLTSGVLPERLQRLGVHPHFVCGALSGSCADLFRNGPTPEFFWTKLRQKVSYQWPDSVVKAVSALQRQFRHRRDQKEWIMLEQGFEPWTSSS